MAWKLEEFEFWWWKGWGDLEGLVKFARGGQEDKNRLQDT